MSGLAKAIQWAIAAVDPNQPVLLSASMQSRTQLRIGVLW
jgi:hypothetical protein